MPKKNKIPPIQKRKPITKPFKVGLSKKQLAEAIQTSIKLAELAYKKAAGYDFQIKSAYKMSKKAAKTSKVLIALVIIQSFILLWIIFS